MSTKKKKRKKLIVLRVYFKITLLLPFVTYGYDISDEFWINNNVEFLIKRCQSCITRIDSDVTLSNCRAAYIKI